ncbi:MAG: deaminase, partial [Nitrososphaera sp.]|nr:deaminase [Nitrososphaera sp.]
KKDREWDIYFLNLAKAIAEKSKDPSMKVGCVIVGPDHDIRSTGYNGFPRGVDYTEIRLQRPAKYDFMVHAEQNAVIHAGRNLAEDCTAYVACTPEEGAGHGPCVECAKALIQAGITRIVEWDVPGKAVKTDETGGWRDKLQTSLAMLREAGVALTYVRP